MKYLIELLKDENTVIIPGLGALTVVNRNPLDLKFMSYLKFNDGTLVKFIAQQEGIEQDDAKAKIDAFVAEVTAVLEQGKSYEIPEVGVLSKDSSGDIQITSPQIEDAVTEEIVTVSETIIEEKQEEIEELPKEETVIKEPEIIESIVEEIEAPTVEPEKKEEKIEVVEEKVEQFVVEKTEPIITPVEENTVKATEEDQWNDDLDLPPLNYKPERPKTPILEKTKKDKKPRNYKQLIWLFVALIIIGGSAYVGFNYKDLKESIPFLASKKEVEEPKEETQKEEPVEVPAEPEVEPEPEIVEPEIIEPVEKPVVKKTAPKATQSAPQHVNVHSGSIKVDKSLPIQVIVGSFGEESNANRMVDKLTAQGFNASVIGVYGGLHTVSVGSFNSMEEFRANQSKFEGAGTYWVKK